MAYPFRKVKRWFVPPELTSGAITAFYDKLVANEAAVDKHFVNLKGRELRKALDFLGLRPYRASAWPADTLQRLLPAYMASRYVPKKLYDPTYGSTEAKTVGSLPWTLLKEGRREVLVKTSSGKYLVSQADSYLERQDLHGIWIKEKTVQGMLTREDWQAQQEVILRRGLGAEQQGIYGFGHGWLSAILPNRHLELAPKAGEAEAVVQLLREHIAPLSEAVRIFHVIPCYAIHWSDGNLHSQKAGLGAYSGGEVDGKVPLLYADRAWGVVFGMPPKGVPNKHGFIACTHALIVRYDDPTKFVVSPWCYRALGKEGGIDLYSAQTGYHTLLSWLGGALLGAILNGQLTIAAAYRWPLWQDYDSTTTELHTGASNEFRYGTILEPAPQAKNFSFSSGSASSSRIENKIRKAIAVSESSIAQAIQQYIKERYSDFVTSLPKQPMRVEKEKRTIQLNPDELAVATHKGIVFGFASSQSKTEGDFMTVHGRSYIEWAKEQHYKDWPTTVGFDKMPLLQPDFYVFSRSEVEPLIEKWLAGLMGQLYTQNKFGTITTWNLRSFSSLPRVGSFKVPRKYYRDSSGRFTTKELATNA